MKRQCSSVGVRERFGDGCNEASYPVTVGGKPVHVKPHDCRRTYARRLYEAGVDPVALQQNLGHSDLKTTIGYIRGGCAVVGE